MCFLLLNEFLFLSCPLVFVADRSAVVIVAQAIAIALSVFANALAGTFRIFR